MNTIFSQMTAIWQRLETPQRVSLVMLAVVFVGVIGVLLYGASRPDMRVLASGLSRAQTTEIAAYLNQQGEPYQLADRDSTVLVLSGRLYSLRNVLAEQEMLGDGSVGFELLESTSMGDSSFKEQKTYDRALAGELERSFRELPGVLGARVIVNRPPVSPFIGDERHPSASVKLDMRGGKRLTPGQLAGVIHLCSGAVDGLQPEDVQVMDNQGLLTRPDEEPGAMAANTALEAERAYEQHLTKKAQSLLDRALGAGRSLVQISVDLDFAKRTEAESTPTNPGVVIVESTEVLDESTPVPIPSGIAGTASNVEGANSGGVSTETATKSTETSTRELATGKRTTTLEDEIGRVRGMTVSILLDHKENQITEAQEDGTELTRTERVAFTADEQNQYQELVLNAIGFYASIGEQQRLDPNDDPSTRFTSTIQSLALAGVPTNEVVGTGNPDAVVMGLTMEELVSYGRYLAAIFVALMVLFIARGQLKRSQAVFDAEQERLRAEEEARKEAEANAEEDSEEVKERRQTLKDLVQVQVREDPAAAANILRAWMNEGSSHAS